LSSSPDPKTFVLLKAARGGDEAAWQDLYQRYSGYLGYVVKMRLVGSPTRGFDADDVLQEAFLNAFRRLSQFEYRGEGSFLAWLTRIVVNQLQNQRRGRGQDEGRLESSWAGALAHEQADPITPSQAMVRAESRERLRQGFEQLAEDEQMLLGLRLGQELTWAQIGELMECSRVLASQRFGQAIERLRRFTDPEPPAAGGGNRH